MNPGSRPLKAGNVYRAEVSVVAAVNGDSGQTVRVSGHVLCEGNSVIEVQSAFFFQGRFTDNETSKFIARTVSFKHPPSP